MKSVDIDKATRTLAEYAREVQAEPLVVTEEGRPVAVLLPLGDTDLETVSLSTDPRFLDLIARSRARLASEGGLSSDEVRRQLGMDE